MTKILFFFLLLTGTLVSQAYDFSAVAPTGQTLYYIITSGTSVTVTCPGVAPIQPYYGYAAPTGDLSIPETVTYNDTTYSVTSIGDKTFYNCYCLTSVTIGSGVTSIQDKAFAGCNHISAITCKAVTPPTVANNDAFEGVWKRLPLTVPSESVSLYQSAYAWSEFPNIIGAMLGIEEASPEYKIVSDNGSIAISGAEGQMLRVCDVQGRMIVFEKAVAGKQYQMPASGTYMVQVGNYPAQNVVVVK